MLAQGIESTHFISPEWPAPKNIKTLVTTRFGGISQGGYAGLNLATHVDDLLTNVTQNRQILAEYTGLKHTEFAWLEQVHGAKHYQCTVQ